MSESLPPLPPKGSIRAMIVAGTIMALAVGISVAITLLVIR